MTFSGRQNFLVTIRFHRIIYLSAIESAIRAEIDDVFCAFPSSAALDGWGNFVKNLYGRREMQYRLLSRSGVESPASFQLCEAPYVIYSGAVLDFPLAFEPGNCAKVLLGVG